MAETTGTPPAPQKPEPIEIQYLRRTANATTVIAWILGILFVLTLIGAILQGIQLAHFQHLINQLSQLNGNVYNSGSNCSSNGGTNPFC
jgi:hypothetical protein